MTKIWSLLYREWKESKKNAIIAALFTVGFTAFDWLMADSALSMNGSNEETAATAVIMANQIILLLPLVALFAALGMDDVFKTDITTGYLTYSYSLPITPFERALVRTIRFSIKCIAAMLFALINAAGISSYMDIEFKLGNTAALFILMLCLILVYMTIMEFFTLRARSDDEYKKMNVRSGLALFFVMIAAALVYIKIKGLNIREMIEKFINSNESEIEPMINKFPPSMLLWTVPLLILLVSARFAVTMYGMRNAYSAQNKGRKKTAETYELSDYSGPTGLLYKEIKQNRTNIIAVALVPMIGFLYAFLMLAFVNLVSPDELVEENAFEMATSMLPRIGIAAATYFIGSSFITGIFKGDDKKLWAYFTVSSPAGVKGFVYYKYVMIFMLNGIYFLSQYFTEMVVSTISWTVFGKELSSIMTVHIAVFFLVLFSSSIDIPNMIRFGEKKGSIIKLALMLGLATVGIVGFSMLPENIAMKLSNTVMSLINGEASDNLMLIISIAPAIAIGAFLLSYKWSCKVFMKGVNEYAK